MNSPIRRMSKTTLTHFWPMFSFYTPWKHQKNLRFSGAFRGYKMGTLVRNRLKKAFWYGLRCYPENIFNFQLTRYFILIYNKLQIYMTPAWVLPTEIAFFGIFNIFLCLYCTFADVNWKILIKIPEMVLSIEFILY